MIMLDTHVLLWVDRDERKLGKKSRALIARRWATESVAVSAITFWEVGMLEATGKIVLPSPLSLWRDSLLQAGLIELPVTGQIAMRAAGLTNLHGDPADRLIAATALANDAALLTADEKLLAWRHVLARHDARD